MWDLWNKTPYAVDRTVAIDKDGGRHWIVVVKATLTIHPDGSTSLADEQAPPVLAPVHAGEPGRSSLLYDSDLVFDKPGTDVVLNASAHAPNGRPVTELSVGVRVGRMQKALVVRGTRWYVRSMLGGVEPSREIEPFVRMPIVYERAYGGFDDTASDARHHKLFTANPVGVGVAAEPEFLLGKATPNIEVPGASPSHPVAAGFGAIDSSWSPRRGYAGTYDAAWTESRKPLLPRDFDERYFMSAPIDQQVYPHLNLDHPLELVNLTPGGTLSVELPKVHLRFTTEFGAYSGREAQTHRAKLHSVIIEPDHPRVMLVWHSRLPCGNAVDDIDGTKIVEKRDVNH